MFAKYRIRPIASMASDQDGGLYWQLTERQFPWIIFGWRLLGCFKSLKEAESHMEKLHDAGGPRYYSMLRDSSEDTDPLGML